MLVAHHDYYASVESWDFRRIREEGSGWLGLLRKKMLVTRQFIVVLDETTFNLLMYELWWQRAWANQCMIFSGWRSLLLPTPLHFDGDICSGVVTWKYEPSWNLLAPYHVGFIFIRVKIISSEPLFLIISKWCKSCLFTRHRWMF